MEDPSADRGTSEQRAVRRGASERRSSERLSGERRSSERRSSERRSPEGGALDRRTIARLKTIAQSYSQAPWRRQLQLIGLFLLFLTLIALVAGIYLSVSAKSTLAGRDIQAKQADIETVDRDIEDAASRLAGIFSADAMQARAEKMGFKPISPEQIVYMKIPGYTGRDNISLAPNTPPELVGAEMTPPEYTESVFVWLRRELTGNVARLIGGAP